MQVFALDQQVSRGNVKEGSLLSHLSIFGDSIFVDIFAELNGRDDGPDAGKNRIFIDNVPFPGKMKTIEY